MEDSHHATHDNVDGSPGGALRDFVSANVGEHGTYENVSEYVRDLIRHDREKAERKAFERLTAELTRAFQAPEDTFLPLSAAEVIARNKARAES